MKNQRLIDSRIIELRTQLDKCTRDRDYFQSLSIRAQERLNTAVDRVVRAETRAGAWMIFSVFGWLFFALSWILPILTHFRHLIHIQ